MAPSRRTLFFALVLGVVGAARGQVAQDLDDGSIGAQIGAIKALHRSAAAAPTPTALRGIDLSGQFPADARSRDQKDIADCHDFAAVAVLEAAYFRATGRHAALSQADLFIQNTMLARDVALRGRTSEIGNVSHPLTSEYITDSGHPRAASETDELIPDLVFGASHGVAAAETLPYAAFLKDYDENQRPALVADMARADQEIAAGMQKNDVDASKTAWVNGTRMDAASVAREAQVQVNIGPRMRQRVAAFLAKQDPQARDAVAVSRANIREVTKNFAVVPLSGMPVCDSDLSGRKQIEFLSAHLGAGRPVAIGLDVAGLKGWGFENSPPGTGHSVVVSGLSYDRGRPVFTIMDWGGPKFNNPLPAAEACRIFTMGAVLIPGER